MSLPAWVREGTLTAAPGLGNGVRGPHQDQLVVGQLTGPVGFGAVPLKQSLCAVDLVLVLPSGQTLRAGKPLVT